MTTMLNALAVYPSPERFQRSSLVNSVGLARPTRQRDAVARAASLVGSAVEDRMQAKLDASPYPAVRRVRCKFEEGLLTLHGTVPNYHCVQLAITLVRAHMPENVPVQSHLRVLNTIEA